MSAIAPAPLPAISLLARHRGPECYRDAFCAHVPRAVSLSEFIAAFYSSPAFTPERMLLHLIGKGASRGDITALADGQSENFAAWSVEAREDHAILLRDFQDRTCSWLCVEPVENGARLWFGSGVRKPQGLVFRALMGFHRAYSRVLLAGAVRKLG